MKKKRLGSYPAFTVIFSIAISLFVVGAFGIVLLHASRLSVIIRQNIEIHVYLHKDLNDTAKTELDAQLRKQNFIDNRDGVLQLTYISKEEAGKAFIEATGEDFYKFLGENPLRDAYTIKIKPAYADSAALRQIKAQLLDMRGVFEVEYVESLIDAVNKNLTRIAIVMISFSLILIITAIILIRNTVKLSLFSQRFLIRSMQLVGARDWFIKRPFVYRAAWHGTLAGIIATALLAGILEYIYQAVPDMEILRDSAKVGILFLILVISGAILGFFSAWFSTGKYLKMSLDELY